MRKAIGILENLFMILILAIAVMFFIFFMYKVRHQTMDTTYMWNINFTNLVIDEGSNKGDINLTNDGLSLNVKFNEELEYYKFSFDIVNEGTLDAKVQSVNVSASGNTDILEYRVNYDTGFSLSEGDIIKSNSKRTVDVEIKYPKQKEKIYDALQLNLDLNMEFNNIN